MKKIVSAVQKYSFVVIVLLLVGIIFNPLILKNQIPFSSNLLVSFFNPWANEPIPGWPQGVPNKPVGIDDVRIFYPQRHFTTESVRSFSLPLWDPHIFSGGYHVGLSETAVFYPLFLLFMFLPQLPIWIAMIVTEPIIASVGMYLFLRQKLKTKYAAIFGSIVFGFSGLILVRMVEGLSVGHTLIWIPWSLFAIEVFFQKKQMRFLLLLLATLSFSILAGWFQFALYGILFSFLYALFKYVATPNKTSMLVFVPFVFLPFITSFQIIPALESFFVSSRGATATHELLQLHLMPFSHLLTYLYPDFWGNPGAYNFFGKSEYKESILFIGVAPVILSLFSLGLIKIKTIRFFWVVTILSWLLGTDSIISRSVLSLPIPIVSAFLPDRVFYFATISLSILSAFGFEWIIEQRKYLFRYVFAVIAFVLLIVIFAHGYIFASLHPGVHGAIFTFLSQLRLVPQQYQLLITQHNLYIPDVFIACCIVGLLCCFWIHKKIVIAIFFLLTFVGQIYFAGKYIPFSQRQFVFPATPVFTYLKQHAGINRFVSTGNGYIAANSSLYFDLYSPDGVGSMYIGRYGELVTFMQTQGKDYVHIPRIEIRIDPSADEILSGSNPYLLRFMQIDGIKYIVRLASDPATVNAHLFAKVWDDRKWEIYAYNDNMQRIFWTNDITLGSSQGDILKKIFSTPRSQNIVLEKPQVFLPTKNAKGSVHVISYKASQILLTSQANGNGYVYISDNFARQFYATVDNKKVSIVRANYSFQAVPVPPGNHTIQIVYKDTFETVGFYIAVGSMGIFGWLMLFFRRKRLTHE